MMFILFLPGVVFAEGTTTYVVCGNNKKIPLVFADLFSTIITFVKIFIPIILIISGMIIFFKAAASGKVDDELKKAKDKMINSFIAATIIFLILSIVSTVLSIFVKSSGNVMGCVRCLFDPSRCETVELANEGVQPGVGNSSNGNLSGYDNHSGSGSGNGSNGSSIQNAPSSFDNFLFIGDSRYVSLANSFKSLGSNVNVAAKESYKATSWISDLDTLPDSASGISIMIGVNGLDYDKMVELLGKLHNKYSNAHIFVNSIYHVGTAYNNPSYNGLIDKYNESVKSYCGEQSWLTYIDVTNDLYDSNGYLDMEFTKDGLHMNSDGSAGGNKILFDNIKAQISKYFSSSTSSSNPEDPYTPGTGIKKVNGVTSYDGIMIVNKSYSIPENYTTGSGCNNSSSFKTEDQKMNCLTEETRKAYREMRADATALGFNMFITSGFRSYSHQASLYSNYVNRDGKAAADRYSARPGYSEHQTGLAFDMVSASDAFTGTPLAKWAAENCYKYGFILRYPEGKEDITGYTYESWHFRFVGKTLAKELYNNGDWITLEEHFDLTSKYAN